MLPRRSKLPARAAPIAGRAPLVAAAAACLAVAGAASGQASSATSAFDGKYAGGAALTRAGATCDPVGGTAQMTVAGTQATIRTILSSGQPGMAFSGAVDRSGAVRAAARNLIVGTDAARELRLEATIAGDEVTGNIVGTGCHWDLNLVKQ
jgi:hypothetical protein